MASDSKASWAAFGREMGAVAKARGAKADAARSPVVPATATAATPNKPVTASAEVQAFVTKNASFMSFTEHGKVHCAACNHDIVATMPWLEKHCALKSHVKRRLRAGVDPAKYLPHLVGHRKDPKNKLWCLLMKKEVSMFPDELEKHVNGKRFKRLKREWEEKQEKKAARAERKRKKAEAWAARQKEEGSDDDGEDGSSKDAEAGAVAEAPAFWTPDMIEHEGSSNEDEGEATGENDDVHTRKKKRRKTSRILEVSSSA